MKNYKRSSNTVRFNTETFADGQKVRIYAIYRYRRLNDGIIKSYTLKYSTGITGPAKYWNKEIQKFKLSTVFNAANKCNEQLDELKRIIERMFQNSTKPVRSNKDAKSRIDIITGKAINRNVGIRDIVSYFDQYILRRKNDGDTSPLTIKRLQTSRNSFKGWLNHIKREKLDFDEFGRDEKEQIINYFFEERKKRLSPTTVAKIMRDIKIVLREAYEDEYTDTLGEIKRVNPSSFYNTKGFIPKRKRKSKHWLNEAELEKLYKYDLSSNPRLDKVRNIFLQAAYSGGLRISDIFRVVPEDFKVYEEGYLLTIYTHKGREVKSDNKVVIPIKGNALELWSKSSFQSFPIMSQQKINEYLKELLELAEINRQVKHIYYDGRDQKVSYDPIYKHTSFHTARFSFINIHIHEKGLSPNEVRGVTGQTLKTLLGYLQNNTEANAERIFSKF